MESAISIDAPITRTASGHRGRAVGAFPRSPAARPHRGTLIALVGLPLTTGAALIAYIVFAIPLPAAAVVFGAAGATTWLLVIPAMTSEQREWIQARAAAGFRAGILGIAAYDLTRYGVVAVASLSFQPFHVFARFGEAIFGPGITEPAASAAGAGFHVANGLGFAIAFALAVPAPTIRLGIAWALCLESLMLLMYPGWLGVSLTGELLPVSIVGHLAFGSVLGAATRRFLR
jgi:hypothetical protein